MPSAVRSLPRPPPLITYHCYRGKRSAHTLGSRWYFHRQKIIVDGSPPAFRAPAAVPPVSTFCVAPSPRPNASFGMRGPDTIRATPHSENSVLLHNLAHFCSGPLNTRPRSSTWIRRIHALIVCSARSTRPPAESPKPSMNISGPESSPQGRDPRALLCGKAGPPDIAGLCAPASPPAPTRPALSMTARSSARAHALGRSQRSARLP